MSELVSARRRLTPVLVVSTVVAYVATLVAIAGWSGGGAATLPHLWMAVPGLLAVYRASGGNWLAASTFGPFVGWGASLLVLLALWTLGGRGPWLLAVAPLAAALLALPARRLVGRWRWTAPAQLDAVALACTLSLVPILVARPFSLVGVERPEGRVYRQYFTADYVWRRAVVAELAKGAMLPANPYYVTDVLHYYWLPHLPDAIVHRARPRFDLDDQLHASAVVADAGFVAALYGVARLVVAAPWASAAGVLCGFLVTSFEAVVVMWLLRARGAPMGLAKFTNIDAISRWEFNGMPIDGLQRILWYQPHHAAGYVLGLLGVLAVVRRTRPRDPTVFTVAGTLLAISTLVSSFAGLMFTAIAATVELVQTVWRRRWVDALFNAPYAAFPLALGSALVTLLHYVDRPDDGSLDVIRLGLNPLATQNFLVVTSMSFGPALLIGSAGLVVAWRRRLADVWPFVLMVGVAFVFYFYVDVRDHQDVYVGWRVGHVSFMAYIPLAALTLDALRYLGGWRRAVATVALGLVVAISLPTVAIDAWSVQNVEDNGLPPEWNRREVLSKAEWEGLQWLKDHTRPEAVVQVDAWERAGGKWAMIPAFAERRLGVGLPISMVPIRKYQEGSRRAEWLYSSPDPVGAHDLASRVGIDYVAVGDVERAKHPGVEARYARVPQLLPLVFHNDVWSIYEVARRGSRP